jgi:hypothetical protein
MAIIVSNPSKLNEKKTVYFISVLLVNEKLMQYKLWNTFFFYKIRLIKNIQRGFYFEITLLGRLSFRLLLHNKKAAAFIKAIRKLTAIGLTFLILKNS